MISAKLQYVENAQSRSFPKLMVPVELPNVPCIGASISIKDDGESPLWTPFKVVAVAYNVDANHTFVDATLYVVDDLED